MEIIKLKEIIKKSKKNCLEGNVSQYYEGYWAGLDFIEREMDKIVQKEKEKDKGNFIETSMKCPICGELIFKHFHTAYGRHFPYYHWFWCRNYCELDCTNCIHSNKDECNANFCLHNSGYEPIPYEGDKNEN